MGRYDVHDGRSCIVEVLDQLLVHVEVVGHPKAQLHGVELVPGLDLHRGQGHHCTMADAVESDLLGAC